MALSNIFREPRREITESAIGLTLFGLATWVDYRFGSWFQVFSGDDAGGVPNCPWQVGMVLGLLVAFVGFIAVTATHALGGAVCDTLERRGIYLRPRDRG